MAVSQGSVIDKQTSDFTVRVAVRDEDLRRFRRREDCYAEFGDQLSTLLDGKVRISQDELFSNAICQELGDLEGRRTKQELAERIPGLKSFITRDLPSSGPLRLTGPAGPGVIEYLGVGLGLSLADKLLQLDASYFRRIPQTPKSKTLDFESAFRASTGRALIQLETKARTNRNNLKPAWADIDAKVRAFRTGESLALDEGHPEYSAPTFLVGTVAHIPQGTNESAEVTIGDPPIPAFDGDPLAVKLLQRLRFYQRVLSIIQPRGMLLAALSERIANIQAAGDNWKSFIKTRIVNSRMEPWELSANIADTIRVTPHDKFHGRAVGPAKPAKTGFYFFIGLHRSVLLDLVRQDLDSIRDTRYETRHITASVDNVQRDFYQAPSGLITSSIASEA